jgi:predicted ABC-type ATPase
LFNIYLPIANDVLIFDNSKGKHELIAKKINQSEISIINNLKFQLIKQYYDNQRDRK